MTRQDLKKNPMNSDQMQGAEASLTQISILWLKAAHMYIHSLLKDHRSFPNIKMSAKSTFWGNLICRRRVADTHKNNFQTLWLSSCGHGCKRVMEPRSKSKKDPHACQETLSPGSRKPESSRGGLWGITKKFPEMKLNFYNFVECEIFH